MKNAIMKLFPWTSRRSAALQRLQQAERVLVEQREQEGHRMSTAATLTIVRDLQDEEQRPYTVKDIEGLRSATAEDEGRGAVMETLCQLQALGITEGFGGKVKREFR